MEQMKNTEQEIWLQKSSNHFRKARGLKVDLDKLVELREGSSSGQGGREGPGVFEAQGEAWPECS